MVSHCYVVSICYPFLHITFPFLASVPHLGYHFSLSWYLWWTASVVPMDTTSIDAEVLYMKLCGIMHDLRTSIFLYTLLLRMCVGLCTYIYGHIQEVARSLCCLSLQLLFHLMFWDRASHWIWSLPIGWKQGREPPVSTSQHWDYKLNSPRAALYGMPGTCTQAVMITQRASTGTSPQPAYVFKPLHISHEAWHTYR